MDLKCTQCGGQTPSSEDTSFVRCPFCETALCLETDRTVSHQYPPASVPNDLGPRLKLRFLIPSLTFRAKPRVRGK